LHEAFCINTSGGAYIITSGVVVCWLEYRDAVELSIQNEKVEFKFFCEEEVRDHKAPATKELYHVAPPGDSVYAARCCAREKFAAFAGV
jgi:hypothetical protein